MRKIYLLFSILVPQVLFCWCSGRIEGIVRDAKTMELLHGAYIVIRNTSMWTTTDENGVYQIDEIPCVGEYDIVAVLRGYRTQAFSIIVQPASNTIINFDLSKTVIQSGDVVITNQNNLVLWEDTPVYTDVINKNELKNENIETVGDAIRWLTGMDTQKYGWSKKVARSRGLPTYDVLILLNGQLVSGGHGNSIDLEHYPAEMVERIEVVKGPYSNLYGDRAIGGVINIITELPKNINYGEYAIGTYQTQIHKLRHGLKRQNFGYILNYNRQETEGIKRSEDKFDASNFNASIKFNLNPDASQEISTLLIEPEFFNQENLNQYRKQKKYRLNTLWINKPHEFAETKTRVSLYRWHNSYVIEDMYIGNKYYDDEHLLEAEFYYTRVIKDAYFNALHRASIGYHFLNNAYNSRHVDNKNRVLHSFFFQDEIQFEDFSLVFSDRVDSYSKWNIQSSPKLGVFYKIRPYLRLRALVGKAFRNPSLTELYSGKFYMPGERGRESRREMFIIGNKKLVTEISTTYQLGVEFMNLKMIASRLTVFRNDINNLIMLYTINSNYLQSGKPLKSYKNIEKAYTQGIEYEARVQIYSNFSCRLGYTFLDTKNYETGHKLPDNLIHSTIFVANWTEPVYKFGLTVSSEYAGPRNITVGVKKFFNEHMVHFKFYKDITANTRVFVSANNIFNKQYAGYPEIPQTEFLSGISINF